jgi:hypothetical protein
MPCAAGPFISHRDWTVRELPLGLPPTCRNLLNGLVRKPCTSARRSTTVSSRTLPHTYDPGWSACRQTARQKNALLGKRAVHAATYCSSGIFAPGVWKLRLAARRRHRRKPRLFFSMTVSVASVTTRSKPSFGSTGAAHSGSRHWTAISPERLSNATRAQAMSTRWSLSTTLDNSTSTSAFDRRRGCAWRSILAVPGGCYSWLARSRPACATGSTTGSPAFGTGSSGSTTPAQCCPRRCVLVPWAASRARFLALGPVLCLDQLIRGFPLVGSLLCGRG